MNNPEVRVDNLTPAMKRVLQLAQIEAEKGHYRFVGIEHVLIGILLEGGNHRLSDAGITVEQLRT